MKAQLKQQTGDMRSVARGNRSALGGFFVLAALGALYYYRRQGGTVSGLLSRGTDALTSAREFVTRVAPAVGDSSDRKTGNMMHTKQPKSISAGARI